MTENPFISLPDKYDAVYSLGMNCACADYLRKYHVRKYAGPFDWIVSDDLLAPFKALSDDMNGFLDFSHLCILSDTVPARPQALTVKQPGTGYVFLHDFTTQSSLPAQIPAVHAKYVRRAARLRADLKGPGRVLLVWYGENAPQADVRSMQTYARDIQKKYGGHVHFLFIFYGQETAPGCGNKDGIFIQSYPASHFTRRQEGHLLWDRANVGSVFARIKLKDSWCSAVKLAAKSVFWRVCSVGILDKQKRHLFLEKHLK